MIPRPFKAVILAAGFGVRMRPLTYDTPKPLMPLWNRPVLDHTLDFLSARGVRDVLINLHYRAHDLMAHLRRQPPARLKINFSFEPEILGTGGVLRRAEWFLDKASFWMINADIAFDLDTRPLTRQMQTNHPLAVLWLTDQAGPRTVEMHDGLIHDFRSRTPGRPNTYTFTGVHLLSPQILNYLPASGYASIIDAYEKALAAGKTVVGVCPKNCRWNDLGTPESYLAAHAEIYRRRNNLAVRARRRTSGIQSGATAATGRHVENFAAVSTGARMAAGADLKHAIIWEGSRLGENAVVRDAIVGRNCEINHTVAQTAVNAAFLDHDTDLRLALTHLNWLPARTTVMPLAPRGSARSFTRLVCEGRSVMLIRYLLERTENALYTRHTRLLRAAAVDVPRLLLDDPRNKLILLEDLGEVSLETLMCDGKTLDLPSQSAGRPKISSRRMPAAISESQIKDLYCRVIDNVLRLHKRATRLICRRRHKTMPEFTFRLYKWERGFFARQFLNRHPQYPPCLTSRIMRELSVTAAVLRDSPCCLIHRDLQSTNILFRGQTPCFIDFQGMRRGAAAYDMASLLCDPYVEMPEACIPELLAYYNRRMPAGRRITEKIFWHAAVERLAQALGAYGRLGANPATRRFNAYIPPALRRMSRALQHLDAHPALKDACIILIGCYNANVSI